MTTSPPGRLVPGAIRFVLAWIPAIALSAIALSTYASEHSSAPPHDETDRAVFQSLADLFDRFRHRADEIWTGDYRLDRMPLLLVREEGGRDRYGFLVNHPRPAALGGVEEALPRNLTLPPIYRLDPLPEKNRIAAIPHFDFSVDLGGTGAFVLKYSAELLGLSDDFASANYEFMDEPSKLLESDEGPVGNDREIPDEQAAFPEPFPELSEEDFIAADRRFMAEQWALYLAHEVFHRFQLDNWNEQSGAQDTADYPLDETHLALIMLETAALRAALDARSEAARAERTRLFIAVREERMGRYAEVELLDLPQEQIEGTAKYMEHRLGSLLGFQYVNLQTFTSPDALMAMPERGIRSHAAFDRFYGTGAALCRLLDAFAVDGWKARVAGGLSPYQLLRDRLAPADAQRGALLSRAKERYRFSNIQDRAKKAAIQAAKEPRDIFAWDDDAF